jgi:hypothetical protein
LLVSGKRGGASPAVKREDRLYVFDGEGAFADYFEPAWPEACGRIVLDNNNLARQVHTTYGLTGIADPNAVIAPAIFDAVFEPRFGTYGRVSVGLQTTGPEVFGRPIADVAFDQWGRAYVVPVVVDPNSDDPNDAPYPAVAQIEFTPGRPRPYRISRLYDDPDATRRADGRRDNRLLNGLREVEVDSQGNVYVINTNSLNESNLLWKYNSATGAMPRRTSLANPERPIVSPTLCVAETQGLLYIGSSGGGPDAIFCDVHCLSLEDLSPERIIRINGMGHITGITADPASGRVWAVGVAMRDIPPKDTSPDPGQLPFYHPYLAVIEPGAMQATAIPLSDPASALMGNDLALPMSVIWMPEPAEPCGRADVNRDGRVDLEDFVILSSQWLEVGQLSSDIAPLPAGDNMVDMLDMALLAEEWLGCAH